jgi:hypothetical protein
MSLKNKLLALIAAGLIFSYAIIAFVTLEIDFSNWTEGARAGLFIAHLPLTSILCVIVWLRHEDKGGDK